jgi:hypothetical protein
VGVVSRATVGCVEGEGTMSERGNAVGFEDTRVKGTTGGGDNALVTPGKRVVVAAPTAGAVVVAFGAVAF